MAAYADITDVRAYADLAADVADDELGKALDQAERDIDGELTGAPTATGLKYDPAALEEWRATALTRAVCAQTEYRLAMGPEFFIRAQHARVRGPDFTTEGRLPYIGPKALRELRDARLLRDRNSVQLAGPYTTWPADVDGSLVDRLLP